MYSTSCRLTGLDGTPSARHWLQAKTKCWWGLQQLCKSCRTCFMFYCMFYFTCDRSFIVGQWSVWSASHTGRGVSVSLVAVWWVCLFSRWLSSSSVTLFSCRRHHGHPLWYGRDTSVVSSRSFTTTLTGLLTIFLDKERVLKLYERTLFFVQKLLLSEFSVP